MFVKIKIDNKLVFYQKAGGLGQPALILHGWGENSERWKDFAKELASQGFQVIVPDLPGFGKSDPPPEAGWSVADYADWTQKFLQALRLKDFFLIGFSFGGRIAIKLAARQPSGLRSLVLIAAAGIIEKLTWRQLAAKFLSQASSRFRVPSSKFQVPALLRRALYRLAGTRDYLQALGPMKATFKKVISEDLTLELSKIKAPTLLIWGKQDRLISLNSARLMQNLIPDSRLKIFKGQGHLLYRKLPKTAARLAGDHFKNV
jgi:pimeloyl-ACP methyl ester carboxylesterase